MVSSMLPSSTKADDSLSYARLDQVRPHPADLTSSVYLRICRVKFASAMVLAGEIASSVGSMDSLRFKTRRSLTDLEATIGDHLFAQ